jgi:hypothetical protein
MPSMKKTDKIVIENYGKNWWWLISDGEMSTVEKFS